MGGLKMIRFFIMALVACSSTAFANEVLCKRYRCDAMPVATVMRGGVYRGYGYGDTLAEAQKKAVQSCRFTNSANSIHCRLLGCEPYHGPAWPIFSSCKDSWPSVKKTSLSEEEQQFLQEIQDI